MEELEVAGGSNCPPGRRWKEGVGDSVESRSYRWLEEEMCGGIGKNGEDLLMPRPGISWNGIGCK